MPSGLIEEEYGMSAWRDSGRNLREVQAHCGGVAAGQDEGGALALPWTDGAKDIGRAGALILCRYRPRAPFGPASRDLVLLADPGLVGEPDLYIGRVDPLAARNGRQGAGEAFLKSSSPPGLGVMARSC